MNIQLGSLGTALGVGAGNLQSPRTIAVSLFQQFGGKGAFDTAGLAQALNQIAQTSPDTAGEVRTEIHRMLSPLGQGQLAREMSVLETAYPAAIDMGEGYVPVADARRTAANQAKFETEIRTSLMYGNAAAVSVHGAKPAIGAWLSREQVLALKITEQDNQRRAIAAGGSSSSGEPSAPVAPTVKAAASQTLAAVGDIPAQKTSSAGDEGRWLDHNAKAKSLIEFSRTNGYIEPGNTAKNMAYADSIWRGGYDSTERFALPVLRARAAESPEYREIIPYLEAKTQEARDMATDAIDTPLAYTMASGVVIAGGMVLGPALGGGYTVTGLISGTEGAAIGSMARDATGNAVSLRSATTDFATGAVGGVAFKGAFDGAAAGVSLGVSRFGKTGADVASEPIGLSGVRANQMAGASREALVRTELAAQYPTANINKEVYLRTIDGKRAIDPLSGEARRIDFVVTENGKVLDSIEVTSLTANKDSQTLKEIMIRNNGGGFIKDPSSEKIIEINSKPTRIVRKP